MIRRVVNLIGLVVMVSAAVLLGAYLSGAAEEQKLTVESSLVPAVDSEGNSSSITFREGTIKITDKKGKVRLKIKDISAPEGTEGTLVISLMVNADDPINVEFPFVVEDDDDAGTSKVDVKVFLPDVLDALLAGDTLEFLGARVLIEDEPIAVTGVTFKPKVLAGNAGQLIYEQQCASCHSLGSFDTDGFAGNLAQEGDDLVNDLGTISGAMDGLVLTDQELQDLAVFLDSFTSPEMSSTGPGQLVWETKECGSCHSLGSFDTDGFAGDLAQEGDDLVNDLGTISGAMDELVLTDQEMQDLAVFLDSFTP